MDRSTLTPTWGDNHRYRGAVNNLIDDAVVYAGEVAGPRPVAYGELKAWRSDWDVAFHQYMDLKAKEQGLRVLSWQWSKEEKELVEVWRFKRNFQKGEFNAVYN